MKSKKDNKKILNMYLRYEFNLPIDVEFVEDINKYQMIIERENKIIHFKKKSIGIRTIRIEDYLMFIEVPQIKSIKKKTVKIINKPIFQRVFNPTN